MKILKLAYDSNRLYFLGFLLLFLAGIFSLLIFGKTVTFIALNSYHPFWLNVFFINYTFIGDGIFALALIAVYFFYFKKKQEALALLYAFLLSGIAVQIIKNLINSPRPKLFFEHGQYLFFIDNLSLSGYASFPSGHTATAFAIATVSMLILKNKKWNLSFLIAAILVGYSRIYLAQHFLLDVLTGALIGTIAAFPAMYLASNSKGIKNSFNKLRRIDNDMVPSNPGPGIIQTN